MGKHRERIDMTGGEDLSADNPFAALRSEGLKSAPLPDTRPKAPGPAPSPKVRETLLLRRLKAGKGGKVVTEVSGFKAAPQQIQELLKRLQARLGTGGTLKGPVIELQGECRDRVKPLLEAEGYRVRD